MPTEGDPLALSDDSPGRARARVARLSLVLRLVTGGNMPPQGVVGEAWFDPIHLAEVVAEFDDVPLVGPLAASLAGRDYRLVKRRLARALGAWLPDDPDEQPLGLGLRDAELALLLHLCAQVVDGSEEPLKSLSSGVLEGYRGQRWTPSADTARVWRKRAADKIAIYLLEQYGAHVGPSSTTSGNEFVGPSDARPIAASEPIGSGASPDPSSSRADVWSSQHSYTDQLRRWIDEAIETSLGIRFDPASLTLLSRARKIQRFLSLEGDPRVQKIEGLAQDVSAIFLEGHNFVLVGPPLAGKTFAMLGLAKKVVEQHQNGGSAAVPFVISGQVVDKDSTVAKAVEKTIGLDPLTDGFYRDTLADNSVPKIFFIDGLQRLNCQDF